MQATAQQPQRAPAGAPIHCDRHRPEQTTLYRLVQQHAASFIEASAPTDDALHALLQTIIARLMKMLTRRGVLVEDMGLSAPIQY